MKSVFANVSSQINLIMSNFHSVQYSFTLQSRKKLKKVSSYMLPFGFIASSVNLEIVLSAAYPDQIYIYDTHCPGRIIHVILYTVLHSASCEIWFFALVMVQRWPIVRCPNIKPTLIRGSVFAGICTVQALQKWILVRTTLSLNRCWFTVGPTSQTVAQQ